MNQLIYPPKLKKGATIGLVCPSSFISEKRIEYIVQVMEELGYKTKLADNLDSNYAGYQAGTGEVRGNWINKMFADKEVDGIFCVRGGDGSSRIMEYLDYEVIKNNPKVFVGYSDVTNLHIGITQNCGFVTFHGPMVSSNMASKFDDETKKSFYQAIEADEDYKFENPKGFELKVLKPGIAEGKLIGGNLSLLSACVGTPYDIDTEGNILFIEEVSEPMSKIEKWLFHLRNAGKFEKCAGVILGQFTNVENEDMPEFDEVRTLADVLEGLDIPVLYNLQSGHGEPMMTIPMGAHCVLDANEGKLTIKVNR